MSAKHGCLVEGASVVALAVPLPGVALVAALVVHQVLLGQRVSVVLLGVRLPGEALVSALVGRQPDSLEIKWLKCFSTNKIIHTQIVSMWNLLA